MYWATPSSVNSSRTFSAEPRPRVLEKRLRRKSTSGRTESYIFLNEINTKHTKRLTKGCPAEHMNITISSLTFTYSPLQPLLRCCRLTAPTKNKTVLLYWKSLNAVNWNELVCLRLSMLSMPFWACGKCTFLHAEIKAHNEHTKLKPTRKKCTLSVQQSKK